MSLENSCNMWVFREGRTTTSGKTAVEGLRSSLCLSTPSTDQLVDALLRAGELECALADTADGDAGTAGSVTSLIAGALVARDGAVSGLDCARELLDRIVVPESITTSPPEGFAYYALHPLDFADLALSLKLQSKRAAVIGIRSIGTTLSAVVSAALQRRGLACERITVRPEGHPYDRRTNFSAEQMRWIAACRAVQAEFLVVDEGPGISGSSFLSVGDALLAAGVAREQITFLCSRGADADQLNAPNGAERWRSYRSVVVAPTEQAPLERGRYVGGGEWRRMFYSDESQWPASWTQMERLKFLSRNARSIFKFHGLGRFGIAVGERARLVGDTGFGPKVLQHSSGFCEFEMLPGRPMAASQTSAAVLERIADYCAMRSVEFQVGSPQPSQLAAMVRFNVGETFGGEAAERVADLPVHRMVIADGRMLPHEWISGASMKKTDNATHGDDHFFPGAVDIAWDLAGAIVEWSMTEDAAQYLLKHYCRRSGDDVRARIDAYLLAYCVFRMAFCGMGAFSMRGCSEEARLRGAAAHYRHLVNAQLNSTPKLERILSAIEAVRRGPSAELGA